MRLRTRLLLATVSILIAAGVWLPCVHFFFRPSRSELVAKRGVAPLARKIANHHLQLWTAPELLDREFHKMRTANAEWDFMGRSFLVWALANIALREPDMKPAALEAMDRIIDHTLDLERERGMYFFLMPYAKANPFVQKPERSQFVDGEIAMMMGMRCLVSDKPAYRAKLSERVGIIVERMERSPTLSAESYPDECWTFCNTVALAAIRVSDHLNGTDHSDLIRRWIELARKKLIDPRTGLLISTYRLSGEPIYQPEGSSIWVVTHCLALLDETFAREQYQRAKKELARNFLGFGFAREWPEGAEDNMDVDSGLVVPGLGTSVASSGLAFVAAGTFKDTEFIRSLSTTLHFMGFPMERNDHLKYAASNQVGDAVVLYGLVLGPIWDHVKKRE